MVDEREPLLTSDAPPQYILTKPVNDPNDTEAARSTSTITQITPTPLPLAQISILWVLYLVYPMVYEIIFPFVNQMLVELEIVRDPSRVGFYSGIIESVFCLASFCTVLPSTAASDRYGRKPVIIIGMLGVALSLTGFGLSRTYFLLVVSRCLSGGLAGVSAAIRVMVGELTDRTNMDAAFNGIAIMYRLGQILGLPIGGLLAHPERTFPTMFGGAFWVHNPFLLPCLAGAAIALIGALLGLIFLPETRKIVPSRPASDDGDSGYLSDDTVLPEDEKPPTILQLLKDPEIRNLVWFNFELCLASEMLFGVYPLFAYSPVSMGGLGFDAAQIGMQLSARAVAHILILFAFNPIFRWFGRTSAVRMHQWCMFLWPMTCVFYPLLSIVARFSKDGTDGWLFWCTNGVFYLLWSIAGFGWTTIGMIVTDASPSASALAGINGIVQMSQALPMAIGPALSTSLFALTIGTEIAGVQLVWIIVFIITLLSAFHCLSQLREPLDDWRLRKSSPLSTPTTPNFD